jgi:hypothetical protein
VQAGATGVFVGSYENTGRAAVGGYAGPS